MGGAKNQMDEWDARGYGDTADAAVCPACVVDETLREMVARDLSEPECSFCGAGSDEDGALPVAAPLERLMDITISACEFFYGDANNEGVPWEMWDEMVVSAADVLDDVVAGDVNDDVLEAMKDAMNDRAWVSLDYGMGSQLDALRSGWRGLVQTIKHHSRFTFLAQPEPPSGRRDELNTQEFLQAVFEILWEYDRVEPLDVTVQLWRGRMVAEASKADGWSAKDFGSPPARKAAANRMSPAGISMFYGSDSIDTVVAEIGAHGTHRYSAVASFVPTRPLKVLNLVDLPPVPSYYEPADRRDYLRLTFLRDFVHDLAQPIVLDGREHIDYVPTQVITEYLRFHPVLDLDGIRFRSAQNAGVNYVLFVDDSGCANVADASPSAVLHFVEGSRQVVRVVATAASR